MNYRTLGKTGIKVSALGFGMMRLPTVEGRIDEEKAIDMVRYAIDNGLNYVDTAWGYHDGNSEVLTGKALLDGYREKVTLVSKAPWWEYKTADDFDRVLDIQLKKLQTGYLDIYLLHALDSNAWNSKIIPLNIVEKAIQAKKDGRIKYLGFSFHDDFTMFKTIVDFYDWDVCQIQFNYLDEYNQAGLKGLKYAADKGIGVIIMEPLLGGKLANVNAEIAEIFDKAYIKKTPVEWALDYLWDKPEVSLMLSGMSNMQQVVDNIEYASRSGIGMFNMRDKQVIDRVKDRFSKYEVIPCTGCQYCIHCPKKINIPQTFALFNEYKNGADYELVRNKYENELPNVSARVSECANCGLCEEKCPQQIKIREQLKKVARTFER